MIQTLQPRTDEQLTIVRDPLRILLVLLTILTISRIHQHYPVLMKFRPVLLLVIAAICYAYLNPSRLTRGNVLSQWPMRLVAALGILTCFSAAFGISLGRTASFFLEWYVKTLAYAFLLALSIRHVRDLLTFVWAYVLSCGILAFFSLFVFGITSSGSRSDFARLSNLYTYDSNDLGVVLMVGLPLTLLVLVATRGVGRWIAAAVLLGIAATISRSGSRGAFLGFVAVAAAALFLVNSVSAGRRLSIMIVAAFALVLGAPVGYWKQMSTVVDPKSDYNYSAIDGRKAVAERGIWYMSRYPFFGLGMNNFPRAECTISPKLKTLNRTGPIRCTAPHNSYIQAGAELGVSGLLVWTSLLFGMIVAPLRLRRRLPKSWQRGTDSERFIYAVTTFFPLAAIGFAVTSFFVSFAWSDPLYVLAGLTTGLYVAVRRMVQEKSGLESSVPALRPAYFPALPGWRVARSAARQRAASAFYASHNAARNA
ncbi:MAG: O-antigen ligase family protein [Gemmatimonadaceae bacterium]